MVQEWNAETKKFESVEWPNEDTAEALKELDRGGGTVIRGPFNISPAVPSDSAFDAGGPPSNPLIARLEQRYREAVEIARRKNADYAKDGDPFANFNLAPMVGVSVERGILVRTMDKIARINNLLDKPASVSGESIHDTILDAVNYLMIFGVMLEMKVDDARRA